MSLINQQAWLLALSLTLPATASRANCNTTTSNYLTPNISNSVSATTVDFCGHTFSNQGLVGIGSLGSNLKDDFGDSLGSFSSMALDLSHWHRSGNSYTGGILIGLPDRGYNNTSTNFYSDYAARLNRFSIRLQPDPGSGTATANSLTLQYLNSLKLKDNRDQDFTGLDPATGISTVMGVKVPLVSSVDKIAMDAEGLAVRQNGSFYVSDEYAANIYYFSPDHKSISLVTGAELDPTSHCIPAQNN